MERDSRAQIKKNGLKMEDLCISECYFVQNIGTGVIVGKDNSRRDHWDQCSWEFLV